MTEPTCVVCLQPVQLIPAGTDCGSLVLRHDLWTHVNPSDQFAPRPHAPLPVARKVRARKAAK